MHQQQQEEEEEEVATTQSSLPACSELEASRAVATGTSQQGSPWPSIPTDASHRGSAGVLLLGLEEEAGAGSGHHSNGRPKPARVSA